MMIWMMCWRTGLSSGSGAIGFSVSRSMTRIACLVAVQGEATIPVDGQRSLLLLVVVVVVTAVEEAFGRTPLSMYSVTLYLRPAVVLMFNTDQNTGLSEFSLCLSRACLGRVIIFNSN
jgi:hypothetical protein